jgi:hypothetical protein
MGLEVQVPARHSCCIKNQKLARRRWLSSLILATQEADIRRIAVRSQPRQIVCETLSQKTSHKIGLVEWFKVKAMNSSPSTTQKKETRNFGGIAK